MILYGYGGHGRVLADCLENSGVLISGVFDDSLKVAVCPYPFFGKYDPAIQKGEKILLAIGNNQIRKKLAGNIKHAPGILQHASAIVSPKSKIGEGTVILIRSVVQTHVAIGRHCIINTGAIVEHDCKIDDFVHIAPGAIICGEVEVGEGTLVGAGAVLLPGIKVGKNCTIGAGAVVVSSVPDELMLVGNPARPLK